MHVGTALPAERIANGGDYQILTASADHTNARHGHTACLPQLNCHSASQSPMTIALGVSGVHGLQVSWVSRIGLSTAKYHCNAEAQGEV